jgi:hypothetical protein
MKTRFLVQAELAMLRNMYAGSEIPDAVLAVADRAKELYEQVSSVTLTKVELVMIAAIAERLPQVEHVVDAAPVDEGAGDGSGEAASPVTEAATAAPRQRNRR